MERSKDLDNQLLMISMGTQASGNKTRKTAEVPTSTPTVKDIKVDGPKIRKKAKAFTDTEMVMFMMVAGKTTVAKGREQ